ncbi:MAG: hypothetical protein L0G63_01095 [Psychrobacter sp.]|uniref:hypothetical protein n=1 Tax=Psychrobacter sp. TaxID=56811 RepID=UPI0026472914|nr:hypothetical protein [Psychrobacter sp.]MDN5619065.1 hypothetical protein [Psychrobacter sp.]
MEYINKDWMVIAGFALSVISVLLIHFLGANPKTHKFVAVAMVAALALMFIGSWS